MRSLLLYLRALVFGLFIVCNAIICSVGVWHFSLAQMISYNPPVDIYLIFLGALGLLFIFSVIWIDMVRKTAVTSRVWFECAWTGVFWVMELAGTAALTASVPTTIMCSSNAALVAPQACTSTKVLLAFTWLIMIIMLVYAVTLTMLAVVHQKQNTDVWHTGVRAFCWFGSHENLESPTVSSTRPGRSDAAALQPQPRHIPPPIFTRFSLQAAEKNPAMNVLPGRTSPPPSHAYPARQHMRQASATNHVSLYPQHIQKNLPTTYAASPSSVQAAIARSVSPPPLGEWPRADIMTRPVDRKKQGHQSSAGSQPPAPVPAEPLPQRPRVPRSRTSSGEMIRPPPLNLGDISIFRKIEDRMQSRS
ncbi:hypothetical protein OE88DRAFT_1653581 [Heliocybe sulcata]|uniref:MARVEL domain-containing protein n=1 Tax=Heliocybe sulcata TaxID=5364 RepID=A0A5C3NDB3_9AGAM|nr:hypothetical protein OE88DRAFT_1653581 [Heliocybe sulcata]